MPAVRAGSAAGLLVAKMDRLSRSVVDGAGLMERAAREGWALHFADLDLIVRKERPHPGAQLWFTDNDDDSPGCGGYRAVPDLAVRRLSKRTLKPSPADPPFR